MNCDCVNWTPNDGTSMGYGHTIAIDPDWRTCANVAHHAVQLRDDATIRMLMARGDTMCERDYRGYTPMLYLLPCCQQFMRGRTLIGEPEREILALLIQTQAKFDSCQYCQRSLLHRYARARLSQHAFSHILIETLVSSGIDIDAQDRWGQTALLYVVRRGYTPLLSALIAAGASVARNDNTRIPLWPLTQFLRVTPKHVMQNVNIGLRLMPVDLLSATRVTEPTILNGQDVVSCQPYPESLICIYLAGCALPTKAERNEFRIAPCRSSFTNLKSLFSGVEPYAWRGLVDQMSMNIIAKESVDVCTALQNLRLPALITYDILCSLFENWPRIAMHCFWEIITHVKHWRSKND